jgi:hypothetical protein
MKGTKEATLSELWSDDLVDRRRRQIYALHLESGHCWQTASEYIYPDGGRIYNVGGFSEYISIIVLCDYHVSRDIRPGIVIIEGGITLRARSRH